MRGLKRSSIRSKIRLGTGRKLSRKRGGNLLTYIAMPVGDQRILPRIEDDDERLQCDFMAQGERMAGLPMLRKGSFQGRRTVCITRRED